MSNQYSQSEIDSAELRYMAGMKKVEREKEKNYQQKRAIMEELDIHNEALERMRQWNDKFSQIISQTPQDIALYDKLLEEYDFATYQTEQYFEEKMAENTRANIALCEKEEALKKDFREALTKQSKRVLLLVLA